MMTGLVEGPLSDLASWDALDSPDRRRIAEALDSQLDDRFRLTGLESFALGSAAHEVATFDLGGDRFILLPGCRATLGYDRDRPFVPSPEQAEDWRKTEKEIDLSLGEYLDYCLTPLRCVAIGPILMEVAARPCDYGQDGAGQHGDLARVREACEGGFRLPTTDEWEYAFGAGARTLFRWGDDCPISCSRQEQEFDLHRRPNAFGLRMSWNPYDLELCERGQFRGGDGGGAVHGGLGKFLSWTPLASAFRIPDDEDIGGWCIEEVWVRRVYPVH